MDDIKNIESQQKFAKNIYLDFMQRRFGITVCCFKDPIQAMIDKYLCDWNTLKSKHVITDSIENEMSTCSIDPNEEKVIWQMVDANSLAKRIEELEKAEDLKDLNFTYLQPASSAVWVIAHNLNKNPSVRIEDATGQDIIGEITYLDTNTVQIDFAIPVSGTAYLN